MREFFLSNENNEIFDLMGKETDFFHSPQGLGISETIESYQLKTIKYVTNKIDEFIPVQGEIIFNDYLDYSAFIKYLNLSKELRFNYTPDPKIGSFYIHADLKVIDKGDKKPETGRLHCAVTFERLSYWIRESKGIIADKNNEGTTEKYPYAYAYTYESSSTYSKYLPVAIMNEGDRSCPLKIEIKGASVNPTWEIGDQKGGMNLTIQNGQTLTIDSREDVFNIDSGGVNLDDYKMQELQNYIFAPVGESTLLLGDVDEAEVTIYEQFVTV